MWKKEDLRGGEKEDLGGEKEDLRGGGHLGLFSSPAFGGTHRALPASHRQPARPPALEAANSRFPAQSRDFGIRGKRRPIVSSSGASLLPCPRPAGPRLHFNGAAALEAPRSWGAH